MDSNPTAVIAEESDQMAIAAGWIAKCPRDPQGRYGFVRSKLLLVTSDREAYASAFSELVRVLGCHQMVRDMTPRVKLLLRSK